MHLPEQSIYIMGFNIPDLPHCLEIKISHSNLLTLKNIRRAPKRKKADCQHFGRFFPVFRIVAKPRYASWLVVILKIISIPLECILPLCDDFCKTTGPE